MDSAASSSASGPAPRHRPRTTKLAKMRHHHHHHHVAKMDKWRLDRRFVVHSRPRIISGRIQQSQHHLQPISRAEYMSKRPKNRARKRYRCHFLASSFSPAFCSTDGSADASVSTISYCSRFAQHHHVASSASTCDQPRFDIPEYVFDPTPCGSPQNHVGCTADGAENVYPPDFLPFGITESFDNSSTYISPSLHDPLTFGFETSHEEHTGPNKPAEYAVSLQCSEFGSPPSSSIIPAYCESGNDANFSASTSSSSVISSQDIYSRKNYDATLSYFEVHLSSFSQTIKFEQIMEGQAYDFERVGNWEHLLDSEAYCNTINQYNLEEDSLSIFRERELRLPLLWGYLDRSHYTGILEPHRHLIVTWQIQHTAKSKYQLQTLFRAVNLLDRSLFHGTFINHKMLSLLGIACLSIAVKLEETQPSEVMRDACEIGKNCFTHEQLLWMERVVLETLNFECAIPTAATFIWDYLKDLEKDKELETLAKYIACLSLTDYEILRFRASVVAASAVFLACLLRKTAPSSTCILENWTGSANDAMTHCVKKLAWLYRRSVERHIKLDRQQLI